VPNEKRPAVSDRAPSTTSTLCTKGSKNRRESDYDPRVIQPMPELAPEQLAHSGRYNGAAEEDPTPEIADCPACGQDSIYHREMDRYVHANGTKNYLCWVHISSGRHDFFAPNEFDVESPDRAEHQGDPPQTEKPDGTPQLADWCLTREQLASLPEPEPLIDNVLDKSSVALLYGKWGSGKSFIAVDWAACIATGKAWQGRQVEQHKVLYLAAEGAHGMKIRADSWEAGWQNRIPDEQFTVLRRAVNLTDYRQVAELAALIDWGGYGFVVIDTIARCMVGADENSAKDCGVVVDALGRLLDKTPGGRGAVTGVHHTGKDGRTFRGSSVFEAGADTVYSVLAEGHAINLNREKRKDGPIADMHGLTIEAVEGTKSCIISLHRGVEKPERAQRLLSTFLHHFSTTGATKTELRVVADLTEGTFYRALSDLVQSGDLVNEGTEKRPFYKAVIR
jgi:hypothetical protein